MSSIVCRDCGSQLQPDARGCPTCALNLDAERMIERVVWQRVLPVVVIVIVAILALAYRLS